MSSLGRFHCFRAMQFRRFTRAFVLCAAAIGAAGVGVKSQAPLRGSNAVARSFVQTLSFKQKLRICNAYPFDAALDVYVAEQKLTMAPLAYKSCGEFLPELHVDDEVSFKVEDSNAGTFTISELPANDAILLMVIYRHDTAGSSVAFESHVFSTVHSAQVAVLDTYKGVAKSELRIMDGHKHKKKLRRSEMLRYDNVVAVDPGIYELSLQTTEGIQKHIAAKAELVAVNSESYVIIRCGVEAQEGTVYPQELMVYPFTDKAQLGAAAGRTLSFVWLLLAVVASLVARV